MLPVSFAVTVGTFSGNSLFLYTALDLALLLGALGYPLEHCHLPSLEAA
jgi:hypothetical protein